MMTFVRELWAFVRVRKKFWLVPMLVVLLLVGLLVVTSSAVSQFIYTVF
jgi:competence protein ComGC